MTALFYEGLSSASGKNLSKTTDSGGGGARGHCPRHTHKMAPQLPSFPSIPPSSRPSFPALPALLAAPVAAICFPGVLHVGLWEVSVRAAPEGTGQGLWFFTSENQP
ncbi:hypothetical protein E2C01_039092 [Portunus trituberculatus]|uniref:Uncharacterized protein n=1 Tax=Portunus trituberculatus TaxID=210409 RepID=A0A5B7FLT9_PORTR|nr:hypothetical protein [Portunus trituberculatus]